MKTVLAAMFVLAAVLGTVVQAADSPHFRGPAGDGVFADTGLLKQWPDAGPKLAWFVKGLGKGYSSAAVAGGVIYVTGMDDKNQGHLYAYSLDGKPKWKADYGPEIGKQGPASPGTRATPTIDGDRIFLMTGLGKLVIFDAAKGQVLKTIDLIEKFGPKQAQFGFSDAILVDGQKIICAPGGPKASLVALDKNTGDTLWQTKNLSEATGYCAARLIRHNGRSLVLTMLANSVVAVDAGTGDVVWQHANRHGAGVQPNPPLYVDGQVFVSSGMGAGASMYALEGNDPNAAPKWSEKSLDCQMQGVVAIDGRIYGTAQSGNKGLICLDWKTGKICWNAPEIKAGIVVAADGMLYVYADDGTVRLVKPNFEKFQTVSQFKVAEGTDEHWAHPTIANGRLYIRHGDVLLAYDIKP
jgi:outer membrane protein assembly factor BamB